MFQSVPPDDAPVIFPLPSARRRRHIDVHSLRKLQPDTVLRALKGFLGDRYEPGGANGGKAKAIYQACVYQGKPSAGVDHAKRLYRLPLRHT